MELWIRSQDREKITKVNSVNVLAFENKITIHGYIDDRNHFWLGNYKTKERALEVLDEIQKLLIPIMSNTSIIKEDVRPEYIYKHYEKVDSEIKVIQLNTYVYEMPKE